MIDLHEEFVAIANAFEQQRLRQETSAGPIWVVSRPGLIAMKRGRGSKQDLADIENLEGISDED